MYRNRSRDRNAVVADGGTEREEFTIREKEPHGLVYFTRYDSVPLMVDALFDAPSHREFSKAELAKKAGLSPKSVRDRLSILHQLGVVEYVGDTGRVTLDLENELTWKLRELDGLLKEAQAPDGETDSVESVDHAEKIVDGG